LNLCIISQEFPPYTNWGGIAAYNSELSDMFARLGHKVTIISRAAEGAPSVEKLSNGVLVKRLGPFIRRKLFVGRTIDRILYTRNVYREVSELDKRTPFDIIETTEVGLEGKKLLECKRFFNRMVIQCNGGNALGILPSGPLLPLHYLDFKWSYFHEIRSLHKVSNIIVTSEATRDVLLSQGVDKKKIVLIYQGIDTERFTPRNSALPSQPLEIGFAGRLEKSKGIDFIWKIIEKLGPECGMRFHFKGKIHPFLQHETKKQFAHYSSYAFYHRPGGHDEMPEYYKSLHVLLQPSRFENFGLVYAEALASGLIVFAGKGGAGTEVVKDGHTGFIVDPDGEIESVVARLKEIAANPEAFELVSRAGRSDVVKRFSLHSCAKQKIDYYREILKRNLA